jgi:hypothetical protein
LPSRTLAWAYSFFTPPDGEKLTYSKTGRFPKVGVPQIIQVIRAVTYSNNHGDSGIPHFPTLVLGSLPKTAATFSPSIESLNDWMYCEVNRLYISYYMHICIYIYKVVQRYNYNYNYLRLYKIILIFSYIIS